MTYILIVEDNIDNAKILSKQLKSENLPIEHLEGGYNVMATVISHPPVIIFMDVNLPDEDGRVLCKSIKNRLGDKAPPIVIMTAGGETYRKTALAMGADSFLTKPLMRSEIMNQLEIFVYSKLAVY